MRPVILRNNNGISYSINGLIGDKVLKLRDKGIRSPMRLAGLTGLPVSHVSKILKANRRN